MAAEQEKVLWSDAVVLQFPMWWFSAPAIMKGWIDRVFTAGFGYGPAVPPPYGEGALAGRRTRRLDGLFTDEPVPFRTLVGGDYDHDMRLPPGVEEAGASGLDLHVRPRG
ncbi:NAD(P)H-dependent oxidoreductase [Kitasatospora sp. NPDC050467]|uniref:NAD(P)H-dependent oxidoreductase n=1 Tax=unclassified Kitasatospora TaxID=2633591 RepID=UPI0037B77C47